MGSHLIVTLREVIEWVALGFEVLAVAVIVGGVLIMAIRRETIHYLFQVGEGAYEGYKHQLGRALLQGLELMVAADVVGRWHLNPHLRILSS